MKTIVLVFLVQMASYSVYAQSSEEKQILGILDAQITAWNEGNLEKFMQGYWQNDSLMFVGKSGVTYGFQNTLNNYRKSYPDKEKMGTLSFDILQVKKLSPDHYHVVGKYMLKRSAGDLSGHYTLLIKKINGKWVIISDHSS